MTDHDLEQPCNVLWLPKLPRPGQIQGGNGRTLETLAEGIKFIMTEIPAQVRSTAWITTDNGSIHYEEIEDIHAQMSC